MSLDVRQLSPTELVRLVNSTPLGAVLSAAKLHRQMDKAGYRIGDGRTINFVRYAAWLAQEFHQRPAPVSYEDRKRKEAQRNLLKTLAGQDIGPLPDVADPARRQAACAGLRVFCETYFAKVFYRPWSDDHLRVIAKIERCILDGGLFAFAMPRGSGKALALNTPLPTPAGWTTMGDVRVGDELFAESGRPCRVTFATEVQHGRPCYRVEFSDGEAIVCDADHLWTVYDRYARINPVTLPTQSMAGRHLLPDTRGRRAHRYRIPLAAPLDLPTAGLCIAPYALGVWLGDGTCANGMVTLNGDDAEELGRYLDASGEPASWREREERGNCRAAVLTKTHSTRTSFQGRLRQMGLLENKHIPAAYLRASRPQRFALLQGLMDTDGYVDDLGHCEIVMKYPRLADTFCELLSTLGIKHGRGQKWVMLNGQEYGPYERICFSVHDKTPVFRLTRKLNRLKPRPRTQPLNGCRHIVAIEPTPSVPVRCIQVDSPSSLYLAGRRMVPTHNTTLARLAALWAVLTGARPFVCLIGGSQDRATELLGSVRRTILSPECEDLRGDFPEALHPLWCLRNNARKQIGQHIDGEPTYCTWAADKLVFPVVTGDRLPATLRESGMLESPSSSAIITVTSLDSNMRGQQHTRMDGTIVRPSLVLLDDPQTRESARSLSQTAFRLQLLNGDVLGMAGPGEKIAAFLACTKMYESDLADQVLDRQKCPQWQGECTKMVYAWPKAEKLWDEYRRIREESLRQGNGGKEATEFYRQHRAGMDEGSKVAWPARQNDDELSAIQHAVNLRCDMGEEAFNAEYQNEPAAKQEADQDLLTPQQVSERTNGRKRGEVPLACTKLTAFIDVHKELLFYCVCAWQDNFTGFVIDYGTFPDQGRSFFTLANARKTMGRTFPGAGEDGAIHAGLEKLVSELLGCDWHKAGGGLLRIDRLFVDMGYKAGVVAAVKHKAGGSAMMLSKGVGIKAGNKPISMYQRRPGWTLGTNWYIPNVRGTSEFPHVCVDVNFWKSFVHGRLAVAPGDPGALTLFGKNASEHSLFGEHISGSESYVVTFGHGRQVHEWKPRPERADNHWFDCLVGCAAAASYENIPLPGAQAAPTRGRKRYTQADLALKEWGGR